MFTTACCAECGQINNSARSDLCSQKCRNIRNRRLKRQNGERAQTDIQTLLSLVPAGGVETKLLGSIDRAISGLLAVK